MSSADTTGFRPVGRQGYLPSGLARRWRRSRHEQISGLLALAEELQGILVPVQADSHYRRRLHGELILAAQRQQGQPGSGGFQQRRKGILIGAAALGSIASVAGVIIAFVLHSRNSRARQTAAG